MRRGGKEAQCACVRGKAGMPPGHVHCKSARRATGTGAPSHQARPVPRTVSACTATVCAAAVRTGVGSAACESWCDFNNGVPSQGWKEVRVLLEGAVKFKGWAKVVEAPSKG